MKLGLITFFACATLTLTGCITAPKGRIDTRFNQGKADNQPQKPATVIIGAVHNEVVGFLKIQKSEELQFTFLPLLPVTQNVDGKVVERHWLNLSAKDRFRIFSVPPGTYLLESITIHRQHSTQRYGVPKSEGDKSNFQFSVEAGEVVNLGFIKSKFTRKDKAWLDLTIEPRTEKAFELLQYTLSEPGPYEAKLQTQMLSIPNRVW